MEQVIYISSDDPRIVNEVVGMMKEGLSQQDMRATKHVVLPLLATTPDGRPNVMKQMWLFKVIIKHDGSATIEKIQ